MPLIPASDFVSGLVELEHASSLVDDVTYPFEYAIREVVVEAPEAAQYLIGFVDREYAVDQISVVCDTPGAATGLLQVGFVRSGDDPAASLTPITDTIGIDGFPAFTPQAMEITAATPYVPANSRIYAEFSGTLDDSSDTPTNFCVHVRLRAGPTVSKISLEQALTKTLATYDEAPTS